MKKVLFFLFYVIFAGSLFAANGFDVTFNQQGPAVYELNFDIGDYRVDDYTANGVIYSRIVFDGSVKTTKKGFSELPYVHASLMLSPDRNIQLEFLGGEYIEIQLPNPLLPSRGVIYRDQDPSTIPYVIDPASVVDEWYPLNVAECKEPFIIKDIRGTSVFVYPFQYNAQKQILRIYNTAKIRIIENDTKPVINPITNASDHILSEMVGVYRSVFINYGLNRDDLTVGEFGEILVICTERDSQAIDPYIEWKIQKGYQVYKEIVPVGTVVKDLIQEKYNANTNILYVLLVGDWADVKSQTLSGYGAPMDPQLGCVVGTDVYADICIGRFSASSPVDVTTQVAKVITYERDPEAGGEWYFKAIGIASSQGPGDDNEMDYEHNDVIFNNKLDPYTYDVYTPIYDPSANTTMVKNAVETGATVINYTGHGSMTSWGTSGFNNNNVATLTNGDKLPVVVSVACNNGDFHNGECFAEAWTKKVNGGAIIFIGASISQPWDPPMRGQDYFMDVLVGGYDYSQYPGQNGISTFESRTTFGSCLFNGLTLMIVESSASEDLETAKTWNLFGDPTLQVRTAMPKEILLSNTVILTGAPFTTTVTANGEPVAGALVALSKDGEAWKGITDENGNVVIEHSLEPGTCKLVVTGQNRMTIYTDATIIPPDGAYLILAESAINDEGGNGNHSADYGEDITLDVWLKNVGIETAYEVSGTIQSADSNITITSNQHSYGDIAADSTVGGSLFGITVGTFVPDMHIVQVDVEMRDNLDSIWISKIFIPLCAPALGVEFDHIDDQAGDNNGRLDPGDIADIYVKGINSGHANTPEAFFSVSTSSDLITINSSTYELGIIEAGAFNLASFNITVSESASLGSVVEFILTIAAGDYSIEVPVALSVGLILEDWETAGFGNFQWSFEGDADWFLSETNPYEGAYCVESGNIGDNQSSELLLAIDVLSDGEISFFKKVSSEDGYDFLDFYIDNVKLGSWAGTVPWGEEVYTVTAGTHLLRWTYSKDVYVSSGSDCAWLDMIVFPPISLPVGIDRIVRNNGEVEVFPNPFNSHFYLSYAIDKTSTVNLSIFNAVGQQIDFIDLGTVQAGSYVFNYQGAGLDKGIYYYRLNIDGNPYSGKLIRTE
jgi:hypothetical protein